MAGIDKTYTDSYKDYMEFVEWAKDKTITFHNGRKVNVRNYIWEYNEEDFLEDGVPHERPIMNTPYFMDIYFIQNCPIKFVQDRMKEVYSEDEYNNFKSMEFPVKLNPDYAKNRKLVIRNNKRTKYPLNNHGYNGFQWWVQCNDFDWWYDDVYKVWVSTEDYYPHNTNTMHAKTVKSIIRQLRKQYLPKGLVFSLTGRLIGEDYEIVVK